MHLSQSEKASSSPLRQGRACKHQVGQELVHRRRDAARSTATPNLTVDGLNLRLARVPQIGWCRGHRANKMAIARRHPGQHL